MDRSGLVFRGAVFCVEKMVAFARHTDGRRSWWNVAERVGEDSCASAAALCGWPVCGLVRLQFCQWPHDWSDAALRATRSFYSPSHEGAPLAEADSR